MRRFFSQNWDVIMYKYSVMNRLALVLSWIIYEMVRTAPPVMPLHSASSRKCIVDITILLESNDVNGRGQDGKTPLMCLCDTPVTKKNVQDTKTIMEVFISKGADVNCRDCYNNTVLHRFINLLYRIQRSDDKKLVMPIIELLIKNGADPSIKNIYGKTCYKIAYEIGATEVADFLNLKCRDYVDGRAQNRQPEFVSRHFVCENVKNRSTFNPYNENNHPICTNNYNDYYANATAPPMEARVLFIKDLNYVLWPYGKKNGFWWERRLFRWKYFNSVMCVNKYFVSLKIWLCKANNDETPTWWKSLS